MPQTIYIVGTDHKYQHRSSKLTGDQHLGFESFIGQIIAENRIALLAEENCIQAVKENELHESVLQLVARSHDIDHLFCELDRKARSERRMGPEDNIRVSGILNSSSPEKIEQLIQDSYRRREAHWLQCIMQKELWPTLFICGANHSEPFHKLVSQSNTHAVLLSDDWSN